MNHLEVQPALTHHRLVNQATLPVMRLSVEGDQETVSVTMRLCMETKQFNVTGVDLGFTLSVRPSQSQRTRLLLIINVFPGSVRIVSKSSLMDLAAQCQRLL